MQVYSGHSDDTEDVCVCVCVVQCIPSVLGTATAVDPVGQDPVAELEF